MSAYNVKVFIVTIFWMRNLHDPSPLYNNVQLRKIHEDLFQTIKQCNEYIHSNQSCKTFLGSCI